jgi:hypothetical protein
LTNRARAGAGVLRPERPPGAGASLPDLIGRIEHKPGHQRECGADHKAERGHREQSAAELVEVELEAGQEEQEGQADDREYGFIRVLSIENIRTDHNPGHEFKHHRRHADENACPTLSARRGSDG